MATLRYGLLALLMLFASEAGANAIVVSWDSSGGEGATGHLRAFSATAPWSTLGPVLDVGTQGRVRTAHGRIYHLSRANGTLSIIDPESFAVDTTLRVEAARDFAVTDPNTAYVTRSASAWLLRVHLGTGATTEVVDLTSLAGEDGIPDMESLIAHEGRLFVQLQRRDDVKGGFAQPKLAVVNLDSETLQGSIDLAGTAPRFKMQIVPETRRLFLSATGGFHDRGGIESVNLDTLSSEGLVVEELVDEVGADLGAFVLVTPDAGWLSFSTDLLLSSHLHPWSISAGVSPVELQTTLNYFTPHLLHDARNDRLYWPQPDGFHVHEASTGRQLTTQPVPVAGIPTDLALIPTAEPIPTLPSTLWAAGLLLLAALGALELRGRPAA